jgi:amidophosphoribosyltransferase
MCLSDERGSVPCSHGRRKDFCGVFGIFGSGEAAARTYLGLYALQHRGQESTGIATADGGTLRLHKGVGLVATVFSHGDELEKLTGQSAIGHNRYSTTGLSGIVNAQPLLIRFKGGQIAGAHNGNVVNAYELRTAMEQKGSIFQTTSDSEIVLHLIARSGKRTIEGMIREGLSRLVGAYCFLFLTPEKLIAVRDPNGFRPLCLGRQGDAVLVASESCAFDILDADYVRDIEPGEMIVVDSRGMRSHRLPPAERKSFCVFEFIYFSRPDSIIYGEKVDKVRRMLGKKLAMEAPAPADIVIAVPDSANTAALGYAQASGLRFELGLIRNHYVGRTFISPDQKERDLDVQIKFNPVSGVLRNKRVVLVEDSIVRGTTLRKLVRLIRKAGPSEIHVRVSSPPIVSPCYYGIDISRKEELIAASHTVEEIRRYIGADSLAYLTVDGMLDGVSNRGDYCTACFTGDYPTKIPESFEKDQFSCCGSGIERG